MFIHSAKYLLSLYYKSYIFPGTGNVAQNKTEEWFPRNLPFSGDNHVTSVKSKQTKQDQAIICAMKKIKQDNKE
jgi:hypothetical protein